MTGKVAIVTGAGHGIGRETGRALASQGAKLVLTARDATAIEKVTAEILASGRSAVAWPCDVAKWSSVQRLAMATHQHFGQIDILINNAAVLGEIARLAEADPTEWARTQATNLIGAFHGVRAVLPVMLAGGGGTIVNLSSGAAGQPLEGWSAYCASKAGLAMLSRAIALEYGDAGIRVFNFSPGMVDTHMQLKARASTIKPAGRLARGALAAPAAPARAITWLCGPDSDDLAGRETSIRDPALRSRAGLPPLEL